ncbi:sulfotransferase family cytosolic 2B member 1 isoform X1 [Alligator sinensis]|uniref:Sulfotransferase n=1 Tax=Alligator sinensis TaxID=38654 RepID=A0A1U7S9U9_ALLSI|nr:sulfotransferase family cytosolic 2B member 1 isoform X1 [Alligator sinensis]XP_006026813.1 sulfotransferase family cytosolic 2B member 1 isoform X1 [Alligator sinensis]
MFKEYFQYKGISFPEFIYSPCALQTVENNFQVLDDDVFNVTYQKSGTVWMLEILSLIQSNGDPSWCQTVPNWDRAPWYETVLGLRRARRNHSPRLISSHLPIQLFAKSFFKSKAKVIYTIRNPKDVLVSLYHFAQMFHPFKDPGSLDQFLEEFLKGDVPFGSWFDHVRGWMGLQGHENFFYITYEELLQDLRGSVEQICQFLGKQLDEQALDSVVANASFQAMRKNKMSNFSTAPSFILNKNSSFLRKGISGDWKNHLTASQSERFDCVYQERMQGLDVTFPWDNQ